MGFLDRLKGLFGKKAQPVSLEAIESINQSQINQSITQSSKEPQLSDETSQIIESTPPIELQKESVQLGLAAGYTGRALKDIESSLVRIESQMTSKEWFIAQFGDQKRALELLESIRDILKLHDDLTMKHFEMVENLIFSLQGIAQKAPEPIRTDMLKQIRVIEAQLPPTPKMRQLANVVKQAGEISYTDLASALGISESALRGLLTLTIRRTGSVQRFEKDGRGWVRPVSSDLINQSSNQSPNEEKD